MDFWEQQGCCDMKLKTCRKNMPLLTEILEYVTLGNMSIMQDTETLPENCVYSVLLGIYEGRKLKTGRG
jgi:hypothetical protein